MRKALELRAGRASEVIELPFRLAEWETEAGRGAQPNHSVSPH